MLYMQEYMFSKEKQKEKNHAFKMKNSDIKITVS